MCKLINVINSNKRSNRSARSGVAMHVSFGAACACVRDHSFDTNAASATHDAQVTVAVKQLKRVSLASPELREVRHWLDSLRVPLALTVVVVVVVVVVGSMQFAAEAVLMADLKPVYSHVLLLCCYSTSLSCSSPPEFCFCCCTNNSIPMLSHFSDCVWNRW
jgi:hypothetical protein